MTDLDTAIKAYILAGSDRADLELAARLEAWRDGWRARGIAQDGAWEAGYAAGILAFKAAQHGIVKALRLELARWDGPRADFGKPRPGDYPGKAGAA
jgi:hypothetical protein